MNDDKVKFPHGACECRKGCGQGCGCSDEVAGPAALEVKRGDGVVRICTRCTHPLDQPSKFLVTEEDRPDPYEAHHPMGASLIGQHLEQKAILRVLMAVEASPPPPVPPVPPVNARTLN